MNKPLLLLTMLIIAGASGLSLLDPGEAASSERSSEPGKLTGKPQSASLRPLSMSDAHAHSIDSADRAGEPVREQILLREQIPRPEEAPAEFTDALVPDEWQEAGAQAAEPTPPDWENPYGGNWHDQGGG